MTHPANKRRDMNQKHIDKALRGMGEAPVQGKTPLRRSPFAQKLAKLRGKK